jgi:hypothetical protein
MLEKLPSLTTCKFFKKYLNTSKKSLANIQYDHNKCAKFEKCQMRGVDYTM